MEKKVKELVYIDSRNYISFDSIKKLYIAIGFISFVILFLAIVGKVLFSIIAIAIWNILYLGLVYALNSKHIVKTFPLRFLVNGIISVFISSLFFILLFTIMMISDIIMPAFVMWILLLYVLFILIYFGLIVYGVHKGTFGRIKEKSKNKTFMIISAVAAEFIPVSGIVGMYFSKMSKKYMSEDIQDTIAILCLVLVIFGSALGYINFIQYYYCKKYSILCDVNGNEVSPLLIPKQKKKKAKKKRSLFAKILITIAWTIAGTLLLLFTIGVVL